MGTPRLCAAAASEVSIVPEASSQPPHRGLWTEGVDLNHCLVPEYMQVAGDRAGRSRSPNALEASSQLPVVGTGLEEWTRTATWCQSMHKRLHP